MKKILSFFLTLSYLFFVGAGQILSAPSLPTPPTFSQIIVKFKNSPSPQLKASIFSSASATSTSSLRLADTFAFKIPSSLKDQIITSLSKNFYIDYAEEDATATKLETPNDPGFGSQWGLTKINAAGAWDSSKGDGVNIAIVDTGVNSSHPDLSGKIITSVDCQTNSACPNITTTDPDGHGTHVAGIAAASTGNALGVAGVGWNAKIMSVKVLSDSGSGTYSGIANGIMWAADNGAKVINLSLGGTTPSITLQNAVDYAWGKGVVVVAAAGNSGNTRALYPAYYTNAIAVAATDLNDKKASWSNYGSWVDIAAPGVNIYSTYNGGYDYLSGTSMSTPFVSGTAALIFAKHSEFSNLDVRNKLQSSADKIAQTGNYWASGRVNACSAVDCITGSASPTATPAPIATPTIAPTATPTPTPVISSTPTPTPSPSASPKPWWCKYLPTWPGCS